MEDTKDMAARKSILPDEAFGHIEEEYATTGNSAFRHFAHHTKDVKNGLDSASVKPALLENAVTELRKSKLSSAVKNKVLRHLRNHSNQVIRNLRKEAEFEDTETDAYMAQADEIEMLFSEISEFADDKQPVKFKFLYDVPLMTVGVHNGIEFKTKELDQMVENFTATKQTFLPAAKVGHWGAFGDDRNKAEEAEGYAIDVRRKGKKAVADFRFNAKFFDEKIATEKVRQLSIELLDGFDYMGEVRDNFLYGVALLGVNPPGVSDLPPLPTVAHAEFSSDSISKARRRVFIIDGLQETTDEEVTGTTTETDVSAVEQEICAETVFTKEGQEMKDQNAPETTETEVAPVIKTSAAPEVAPTEDFQAKFQANLEAALEAQKKEFAQQLVSLREENQNLSTALKSFTVETRQQKNRAEAARLVKEQKLAPADEELMFSMLEVIDTGARKINFVADINDLDEAGAPKAAERSSREIFMELFEKRTPLVEMGERSVDVDSQKAPDIADAQRKFENINGVDREVLYSDVAALAKKYIAEGMNLTDAYVKAAEECNYQA